MKITLICLFSMILMSAFGQTKLAQSKTLFDSKKYIEANKILITIDKKDKDYAEANFLMGKIAFEQKKYEIASEYFETAIDANDKVADYYLWLGNSYGATAQKASMVKQGILAPKIHDAWKNAAELDQKNIEVRYNLISFYLMAPSFMGGSTSKAKETADEIRKINPAEGHLALGSIYQKEKNIAEAEKEFIQMAKLKPEYRNHLSNFYINQKLYTKALTIVETVLKETPEDYYWLYQLGKISALSGMRLDQGQEALEKYLTHKPLPNEPSISGAQTRLAQIYERRGNKAEAKKYFELSVKADPKFKEAKDGLARVSK